MLHITRPIPKETLKLLVFDLDGTLIDSRTDLCASVNAMLAFVNRPALPEDVIASFIGDGVSMLVRRSLEHFGKRGGLSSAAEIAPFKDKTPGTSRAPVYATEHALNEPVREALVDHAVEYFLGHYREHKLDHTVVYDGVYEVLAELRKKYFRERQMAVLSNKPVGPSRDICDALELTPYFFQVYGGNSFSTKKPDAQGLQALITEAGVRPEETLMIGDTDVDILTARNAAAWSLGCKFGLSPHTLEYVLPDCKVDVPWDWLSALI